MHGQQQQQPLPMMAMVVPLPLPPSSALGMLLGVGTVVGSLVV